MPQIDLKTIAAATLLLGLFAGFYIDNTLLSKPRIETLTQTVTEQTATITTLETQLDTLDDEHNTLQALYDQLNANNVPLSQYTELEQQNEEQETTITELEDQINSLSDMLTTQENTITDLDNQLETLHEHYNRLEEKYLEIYDPPFVSFTLNGLDINLTVTSTSYTDNTPIIGTLTVKNSDGSPFLGAFKLTLFKLYQNTGTSSQSYTINKKVVDYTWNSPFILGAGTYSLSLSELRNLGDEDVATYSQLRQYKIIIFMG